MPGITSKSSAPTTMAAIDNILRVEPPGARSELIKCPPRAKLIVPSSIILEVDSIIAHHARGRQSGAPPLIAGQPDIRARIEQLKLSDNGYRRQLALLNVSPERRERLEIDVRLLQEEIAALEKLAQLRRIEPDPQKVEDAVRERLDSLRTRMSADPALAHLTEEERELTSGEVKGLLWALGEDPLTAKMRQLMPPRDPSDTGRTDRAAASI